MNKAELIERVSKDSDVPKAHIEKILDVTIEVVRQAVKRGEEVKLVGFGTFTKAKRKARTGRNPQNGKEIKIPASWVPKFRAGSDFKTLIN